MYALPLSESEYLFMRQYGLIALLGLLLTACDAKDECLDAGGSWQEETKTCQK